MWNAPEIDDDARAVRPIVARRAVLSVLILSNDAVSIREVRHHLTSAGIHVSAARVSDILRYQCHVGHAERVARGRYRYVPGSLSRSTAWRCVNWQTSCRHALNQR